MSNHTSVTRTDGALPASPVPPTRWELTRDLVKFEARLLVDGLKDIVLAPLALAAVLADMVLPQESRGVFLRAVMRLGERFESWLNLYGRRRRSNARSILDEGGSEVIFDYLESTARDLGKEIRDRSRTPADGGG